MFYCAQDQKPIFIFVVDPSKLRVGKYFTFYIWKAKFKNVILFELSVRSENP